MISTLKHPLFLEWDEHLEWAMGVNRQHCGSEISRGEGPPTSLKAIASILGKGIMAGMLCHAIDGAFNMSLIESHRPIRDASPRDTGCDVGRVLLRSRTRAEGGDTSEVWNLVG
jgi:hypothetical protein